MPRLASLLLSLTFVATLACSSEPAPPAATDAAANADGGGEAPATNTAAPVEGPKITCADAVYDFGAIAPTATVEHVFTIKNEGTADLKIERIQKT